MRKPRNFFVATCLLFFTILIPFRGFAQDCSACDPANPDFTIILVPEITVTNAMGGTVITTFTVFLQNNTASNLTMVTITLDFAINLTNVSSLIDLNSDAAQFPNSEVFDAIGGNFVIIFDDPILLVSNTIGGNLYNGLYSYDHIIVGPAFPPQVILPGNSDEIMTITVTMDGTQTFQDVNGSATDFVGGTDFFNVYSGSCVDLQPNVNNTFGFIDGFGNQVLGNCYDAYIQAPPIFLPIELESFTGKVYRDNNSIFWMTSSEINTKNYIIERSTDPIGGEFIEIGRVDAAGTSNSVSEYQFQDNDPEPISYYRLKTIDNDGSYSYSDILLLKREVDFGDVSIYPNPATNNLRLRHGLQGITDLNVKIIDVLGKTIYQHSYVEGFGDEVDINIDGLSTGVYFLEISSGEIFTFKELVISR